MKKLFVFIILMGFVTVANTASAEPNLVGTWCISMSDAISGIDEGVDPQPHNPPHIGNFEDQITYEMVIDSQQSMQYGLGFYGHVDIYENDVVVEVTYFSGMLKGKKFYMTNWDSVTKGTLSRRKDKTLVVKFINQAFSADNRSSKTASGKAVKGNCAPAP